VKTSYLFYTSCVLVLVAGVLSGFAEPEIKKNKNQSHINHGMRTKSQHYTNFIENVHHRYHKGIVKINHKEPQIQQTLSHVYGFGAPPHFFILKRLA
jgi:hypothetical protein